MRRHWQLLRAAPAGALILLAIDGGVEAGPFEDGETTHKSGDYATAVQGFWVRWRNKATPPRNATAASSRLLAAVYRRTFAWRQHGIASPPIRAWQTRSTILALCMKRALACPRTTPKPQNCIA